MSGFLWYVGMLSAGRPGPRAGGPVTGDPAGPVCEVKLRDGPYAGSAFTIARIEDTLLVADEPLDPQTGPIDPHDPPVSVAVYELVWEFRDPDGYREGTYTYTGHRYPRTRR